MVDEIFAGNIELFFKTFPLYNYYMLKKYGIDNYKKYNMYNYVIDNSYIDVTIQTGEYDKNEIAANLKRMINLFGVDQIINIVMNDKLKSLLFIQVICYLSKNFSFCLNSIKFYNVVIEKINYFFENNEDIFNDVCNELGHEENILLTFLNNIKMYGNIIS